MLKFQSRFYSGQSTIHGFERTEKKKLHSNSYIKIRTLECFSEEPNTVYNIVIITFKFPGQHLFSGGVEQIKKVAESFPWSYNLSKGSGHKTIYSYHKKIQ